jgi:hypothetical protein
MNRNPEQQQKRTALRTKHHAFQDKTVIHGTSSRVQSPKQDGLNRGGSGQNHVEERSGRSENILVSEFRMHTIVATVAISK